MAIMLSPANWIIKNVEICNVSFFSTRLVLNLNRCVTFNITNCACNDPKDVKFNWTFIC